ncbi:amylo-alpha-1,6-glucosidase [Dactylosporangium aurantiacum]|uniref:Amylo-alpha-1,6-glucosidase n=1 Tax=Dactylosporangium aurantiacum TaxID=35754 RepID=A0A9Q9MGZ5_9ACTN|nr:glycogen debranching N-terminal domain-containing protein [Dactylosporangium aurantiacum]MDG6103969.1 glycogen debranching N-terminal domain-containing protein [Dactylosporangium aurantiacum]UWZ58853.1 amylo-alpha-1,6-glucosidase [Dactylosporangium aurantiacum]
MTAEQSTQPLLHDLVPTVAAPSSALSGRDGQIRAAGVQGLFHVDRRVLSEAVLRVDGHEPEPISYAPAGPGAARFVGLLRHFGGRTPDTAVRVDRLRRVLPSAMSEQIRVTSAALDTVSCTVTLDLASDNALIERVKDGAAEPPRATTATSDGLAWPGGTTVAAAEALVTTSPARLSWLVTLAPGESVTLRWRVDLQSRGAVVAAPDRPVEWARPDVRADDRRLVRLLDQALDDLESLRLTDDPGSGDTFLGAGVPWFLALFGRDSIWAARMLLPLGTDLAAGTLRVLARRQGQRLDPRTAEAPGKIVHEIRQESVTLPASYYGTIDATPLWISLLHDAWCWGMPADQVAALLPNLDAALTWIERYADADGDGFLEYVDATGQGLANQGWKDSADAVRHRDGRLATAPIALCEVQGYAYAAAMHGARLLDAFGRPGADRWRDYADAMAARFRERFWVPGPDGGYPALALDGDKRQVDALTSNIGHLLGTGLLNADEEKAVAERLVAPDLASGYGLRTMSTRDGGYAPLSYHCGSVWPHDTAIVMLGMTRAGHSDAAAVLAEGLLTAAEAFEYRHPELYAGDSSTDTGRPVPYPASCRPQAWSAAASVAILQALLGLDPDVPAGRLSLAPPAARPLGAITAKGLRIAGRSVDITVARGAQPAVAGLPDGITVRTAMP